MDEGQISLREKKFAKTKIALLNEFIKQMKHSRFESICIKDVCNKVEVSEGTFFNYFPQKVDVLIYYRTLTVTKMNWYLNFYRHDLSALEKIDVAFELIADELKESNFFYEMVKTFISEKVKYKTVDLSPVEKYYTFPDCPGIESTPSLHIDEIFKKLLEQAAAAKEISKTLNGNGNTIQMFLLSLLIGLPLAIEVEDFPRLKEIYKGQLQILWKSLDRKAKRA